MIGWMSKIVDLMSLRSGPFEASETKPFVRSSPTDRRRGAGEKAARLASTVTAMEREKGPPTQLDSSLCK